MSSLVYVLGGMCPGSKFQGGKCPGVYGLGVSVRGVHVLGEEGVVLSPCRVLSPTTLQWKDKYKFIGLSPHITVFCRLVEP